MNLKRHIEDTALVEAIEKLQPPEWVGIIKSILAVQPINLMIDFSRLEAETRLEEIYTLILALKNVDEQKFQQAAISILVEYYSAWGKDDETEELIRFIGKIKPSGFLKEIGNLLLDPALDFRKKAAFENHIPLYYRLCYSLLSFGPRCEFWDSLLHDTGSSHSVLYYQLCVQYLHDYKEQPDFNTFFTRSIRDITPEKAELVCHAILDSADKHRSFTFLFKWLEEIVKSKAEHSHENLKILSGQLFQWLYRDLDRTDHYKNYYKVLACLGLINSQLFATEEMLTSFTKLVQMDETLIEEKKSQTDVLGRAYILRGRLGFYRDDTSATWAVFVKGAHLPEKKVSFAYHEILTELREYEISITERGSLKTRPD